MIEFNDWVLIKLMIYVLFRNCRKWKDIYLAIDFLLDYNNKFCLSNVLLVAVVRDIFTNIIK